MRKYAEWIENFLAQESSAEETLSAEASLDEAVTAEAMDHSAHQCGAECAHVTEEEQDKREEEASEGYEMSEDSPEMKHVEEGEMASEKEFEHENDRDMTTPDGRYMAASWSTESLEAFAKATAQEILSEIEANALNPAEQMLNQMVPVAQLAKLLPSVQSELFNNGLEKVAFNQTQKRIAEVINVTLPIEVSMGDASVEECEECEHEPPAAPEMEVPVVAEDMMHHMASRTNRFKK